MTAGESTTNDTQDHDQRIKTVIEAMPGDFFCGFLPALAASLDFERIEWIPNEAFPDPPQGTRRRLDLLFKLPVTDDFVGLRAWLVEQGYLTEEESRVTLAPIRPASVPSPEKSLVDPDEVQAVDDEHPFGLAVVQFESEARDSLKAFRPRGLDYYCYVRWKYRGVFLIPIVLFPTHSLEGVGFDTHVEGIGPLVILRYRYFVIALKGLDAEEFIRGGNPVAAALSGLMKCPEAACPRVKAEAADAICRAGRNDWQNYLLYECLDAYFPLNERELVEYERTLTKEPFQETKAMITTTLDRARAEGRQEGRQEGREEGRADERRRLVLSLLKRKFAPLPPEVVRFVETCPADRLVDLPLQILDAASINELHLAE